MAVGGDETPLTPVNNRDGTDHDRDLSLERVELADALLAAHADYLVATIQRLPRHVLAKFSRGPDDADFHVLSINPLIAVRH